MITKRGFTLVELMLVIAITGITMAYGVPKISQIMQGNRVVAALNSLSAHLNYARSEAIKRSSCVSVIPLDGDPPLDWVLGWQVFVDNNCNGSLQAPGEQVLRIVDNLNIPNVTITPTVDYVIYDRLGNTIDTNGVSANENNFVLSGYGKADKILTVSATGHVALK